MSKAEEYREYFNKFNNDWLKGAYSKMDYHYPVGYHRLRILLKAIGDDDLDEKRVLDIGCGGGDISFALAQKGAIVTGIDMSDSMLDVANHRKREEDNINCRVDFRKENVMQLSEAITKEKYDYIIAFGLIGYLDSDEQFFEIIKKLSKANTILFLSCRNELFNITSVSTNTVEEIKSGNAFELIKEIDKYYEKEIAYEKSRMFIDEISHAIEEINRLGCSESEQIIEKEGRDEGRSGEMPMLHEMPRQATPNSLKKIAERYGYSFCQYWGVHPHLLLPKFNSKLPPKVFNILSDALCVFEDEEISLIWSSVFIGKFCFMNK